MLSLLRDTDQMQQGLNLSNLVGLNVTLRLGPSAPWGPAKGQRLVCHIAAQYNIAGLHSHTRSIKQRTI
ncbi:hypothetical protein F2P81_008141 [Scophthalmus maximus]|uniref:Uncharacterized protein n=1 Tax=Scophthalmus maximus TaxID=52904 RepID=A0A6A4SXF2_SCOMX|nr:hypothetical protein F2P81_008141 [Scophthalmus maximus]